MLKDDAFITKGSLDRTLVKKQNKLIYSDTEPTEATDGDVWCNEGGEPSSEGIVEQFTYVVDSDQKLADWANNVAGNDYTSVLIKKGTWSLDGKYITIASGTLRIKGEAGSNLVFNASYGFMYSGDPKKAKHSIDGVSISANGNYSCAFYQCANLTNCNVISTTYGGFEGCENLVHCNVISTVSSAEFGFNGCKYLVNCTSNINGEIPTESFFSGFYSCKHLVNCRGNGKYGFKFSTYLTQCGGAGTSYGFESCRGLQGCYAYAHCGTSVFNGCFASDTNVSDYSAADTPNGGFNHTTNPAAED